MKRFLAGVIALAFMAALTGCSAGNKEQKPSGSPAESAADAASSIQPGKPSKALVVYFSCTGTTKRIAEYIGQAQKAALYEIVPKIPYTQADLAYYTDCRADREQNDPAARPAIEGTVENMNEYDTLFIGYPIWHGQAPKIVYTFLESYALAGKTIVPFCTSHSSGIGSSDTNLHVLAEKANWLAGRRFGGDTEADELVQWLHTLDLSGAGG